MSKWSKIYINYIYSRKNYYIILNRSNLFKVINMGISEH